MMPSRLPSGVKDEADKRKAEEQVDAGLMDLRV